MYRYSLTRRWAAFDPVHGNQPRMCFIMLNPSTADATENDRTISRCIEFAKRENCCALSVVNLFAYRTPYPKELWEAHRKGVNICGPDNQKHIFERATAPDTKVVAAWGAAKNESQVQRGLEVLTLLRGVDIYCLGHTKNKDPKHPLYLPKNTELELWNCRL